MLGTGGQPPLARMEHRTGDRWRVIDTPSPGSTFLYGVSAVSSDDVWSVGSFQNGPSARAFVTHWDGTEWAQVAAPSPGGRHHTKLQSVSADSPTDGWAVGWFQKGAQAVPIVELGRHRLDRLAEGPPGDAARESGRMTMDG
jgi:hypothetical protein